jgi:signal transduction histidine kinase
MAVPVTSRARLVGVVYADTQLAEGFFTREDVDILAAIGGHVAISLETAKSAQELRVARDVALASSKTQSQFLHAISHELRTPLNAVLGYTELLQETAADDDNHEYARDLMHIKSAADHLLRLITDVLDLTRDDALARELTLSSFELGALLEAARVNLGAQIARRDNAICVRCTPERGATITSDRTLLLRVLTNLVDNANKFTRGGTITLTGAVTPQRVTIAVSDTGAGIPEEALLRVFDEFFQVDMSSTRVQDGLGVGLAVSRRIVRELGGELRVESSEGVGSTFTIELPRALDRSPTPRS